MKKTIEPLNPKKLQPGARAPSAPGVRWSATLLIGAVLAACGGGGGGGGSVSPPVETPEAVVQSVGNAQVLEGNSAGTNLEFAVTLDKAVVRGLDVTFSTQSTAVSAGDSTAAKGAAACAAGVDYVSASSAKQSIAVGASSAKLLVAVCGNTAFAPNKTFKVAWSAGSASGTATGTIVNDDAGGLNGVGVLTTLGGKAAFGRDANALTNAANDGALGFSFAKQPSAASWGCSYDNVTGRSWQRVDSAAASKNYASLGAYVAAVNATAPCNHSDWRLPTAGELLSLMDASVAYGAAPNADRDGTADAMNARYWSAEVVVAATNNAYVLDAGNGGAVSYVAQTDLNAVRLVRGGTSAPACDNADQRYTDNLDGTVSDARTGLMWMKCTLGLTGTACAGGAAQSVASAAEALSRLNESNAPGAGLGYADWRIPNRNELESLLKRSCTGGAKIVPGVFPASEAVSYLSSTPDANNPAQFWAVNFADGGVLVAPFTGGKRLRLVRAGQ